jgi:hypothetical protein
VSFYRFKKEDIIDTSIVAYPSYNVELNGDQVTGSIYLERQYINTGLAERLMYGFSAKEGGFVTGSHPLTASIDIVDAESGSANTNRQLYRSILQLYDYYSLINSDYTANVTGSTTTRFRVITVPEIYYDREILSGAFSASDINSSAESRVLFDNGRGGIYSGSLTGTLVGNIFYSEGLVVLKAGGLNDEAGSNDFGKDSSTNFKWRVQFKGTHKVPVKIFRCRAPAGQLNASTNSSFYVVPSGSSDLYKHEREIIFERPFTYISTIGIFNKNYELVGLAKLAQPIKKEEDQDLLFRVRLDF